jgi:hypothetical protein
MGQADMIRGYEAPHGGLVLFATSSRRQRALRRRWLALSVILGVALAGGVIGQMSASRDDASRPVPPGPLSYLPQ